MDNLLWSEDEIKVSSEGFLLVVDPQEHSLDEEQPILLHSTSACLRELYPKREISEILLRSGFESEDDGEETVTTGESASMENPEVVSPADENQKNEVGQPDVAAAKPIPPQYRIYQRLDRVENLANRTHSALQDIRNFRHRVGGCRSDYSKGSEKIRALQFQQNHLLRSNSEANSEESVTQDGSKNDADKAEEPIVIKLARTINSIRALFPHLLPILNHERLSDKKLVIGKIRYKTRRNGAMCWLLGTESFDSCSMKRVVTAQGDTKHILEAFLGIELAAEISKDPKGSPSFWSKLWIENVVKHSNPSLISPLKVLATNSGASEERIEDEGRSCDTIISEREKASSEGLDQQYKKAVRKIHQRLSNVLTSRFHGARLSIYGSCLSNLALGKGSDVDMSLWIPAADSLKKEFDSGRVDAREYDQSMKKMVYQVCRKLSKLKAEFRGMTPITQARIPVISGTYVYAGNPYTEDGSIDFDICFLNDIAVANSNLLRDYSLVDPRVRSLMITVKQWTKEQNINSAKEKCISSYSWMNLVVFYLQCIGFLPNLQCPALMEAAGVVPDREGNYWHSINNLDTCTLKWEDIEGKGLWAMPSEFDGLSLSLLLYGFFEFYASRFPFGTRAVSIKRANVSLSKLAAKKVNSFLSIEDPFETYDSYCPHDLGSPANDYGSAKMMNCLRDAEEYLRMVLCSEKVSEGKLWPKPPFVEPEPTRNNAKKTGFKRFEPPIVLRNDNPHSNINNDDKPFVPTVTTANANHMRQNNRWVRGGRGRGRGRYGRAKERRVPPTS